jgi:hypothetical protein
MTRTDSWGIRSGPQRKPPTLSAISDAIYPEYLENLRVLDEHEAAAHEAAMRGTGMHTWRPSEAIAGPVETRPCVYAGAA